jgi:hypothetical protein
VKQSIIIQTIETIPLTFEQKDHCRHKETEKVNLPNLFTNPITDDDGSITIIHHSFKSLLVRVIAVLLAKAMDEKIRGHSKGSNPHVGISTRNYRR